MPPPAIGLTNCLRRRQSCPAMPIFRPAWNGCWRLLQHTRKLRRLAGLIVLGQRRRQTLETGDRPMNFLRIATVTAALLALLGSAVEAQTTLRVGLAEDP